MSKTTIIYNDATQDGILCHEIARRNFSTAEFVGWHSGAPALKFPEEGKIVVLDLPLDLPFGSPQPHDCIGNWERLVWIDNDPRAIFDTSAGVPGLRIAGVASSRLAWQWFLIRDTAEDRLPALPPTLEDFSGGENVLAEPEWLRNFQEAAQFGEGRNMWIPQGLLDILGPNWMTYLDEDGRRIFRSIAQPPRKIITMADVNAGRLVPKSNLVAELLDYLDSIEITSDNIGAIRARLLTPWSYSFNAVVRDETARRENRGCPHE